MMKMSRREVWAREVSFFLSERWRAVPIYSLDNLANFLATKREWNDLSPQLAANLFSAWTEEYCWVDGINFIMRTTSPGAEPDKRLVESSDLYYVNGVSPSMCYRAKELQTFWEAAGYPEVVRPTEKALIAIRTYDQSQKAVSRERTVFDLFATLQNFSR